MPIKETVSYDMFDSKNTKKKVTKDENPIVNQVLFFAKMFEKYTSEDLQENKETFNEINNLKKVNKNVDYSQTEDLKEIIYKTYAKSIDQAKLLQKKEKKKMKKIMNLLIYLQMKKIELKLNYFNDFDKLVQFNKQQIKTMQSQFISDRINLAMNKIEIQNLSNKLKENLKYYSEFNDVCQIISNTSSEKFKTEMNDIKILDLK